MSGFSQSAVSCIERRGSMHYSPHINSRAFLFEIFKDLRKKHGGEAQSDEGKNWDGGLYTVEMEKTRAIWTRWSCQEGPKGRMKPAGACHVCIWPHNLWQTPDPRGHKWSRGRHEDHLLASHTRSKAKHSSRHYSLCLPELWNGEWRLFSSYRLLPMNFLLGHLRKAEKANGFSKQKNKP